jgi:hypothetical protein
MKVNSILKNKTIISFIAAFIVSTLIYVFVRHGQLYPVPFYIMPCSPGGSGNVCNVPDNSSLTALYVNIIFVWFIFFFFYIVLSIIEIFKNYSKYQGNEPAKPKQ